MASTRFAGLSSGAGFAIESKAYPSFSYWDTVEFLALGSAAPTVGTSSTITFNGVSGRFNNNNNNRLLQIVDRATGTTLASASWTLGTSGPISFVFSGEFVDGDLKLTLTATNTANASQTITHAIASHAYTSSHIWAGFGGYIAGAGRSIAFDSYGISSVVLPPHGTVITIL